MRSRTTRIWTLAGLVAACGGPPVEVPWVARDSAGIRIIENHAPSGPALVLDSLPAVRIAPGQPGAPEFYSPISAVRLADGRFVAAGWAMTEIHLFGPDGVWQGTVGRRGSGPGEFEALGFVYRVRGDTLLTFEPGSQRLQRWTPDGVPVSLELLVSPPGLPSANVRGPFPDGTLLLTASVPDQAASTELLIYSRVTLYRAQPDGTAWDSLLSYAGAPSIRSAENPQFQWGRPLLAPAPSIDHHAGRFAYSPGDRFEVQVYDLNGRLQQVIRREAVPRPVSSAEVAAAIQRWGESMSPERWERMEPRIRETATTRVRPAVRTVRYSSDGRLWVEYGSPELGETVHASVFDPEGRWQGDVAIPEGLVILQVYPDGVLGFRRTEDGFYHLEFYGLRAR